jgi:predicted MPP superfamily phosphohydrolase
MPTLVFLSLLCWLSACTTKVELPSRDAKDSGSEAPLRVVFIADTHVIGPQYECCSESEGIDNDSIMRTPDRLAQTVSEINAIDPPPSHVFVLGDVVHAAHHGTNFEWYTSGENAFTRASELLSGLNMPVHILWGNHDYEVACGGGEGHHSRSFSHSLFSHFFGANPYGSVDAGGWRFVLLNSQLGPTWDASSAQCATNMGSYGVDQLAWLDEQLAEGKPSIVMSHHHMIASTARNENDGPNPDLSTVLGRHDNVSAHLAGHLHRWVDLDATEVHPVRHIILGATRYDTDNFWLVEFDASGDFEIVDYDKPKWSTTCADTWSYTGDPGPVLAAIEEGECGT